MNLTKPQKLLAAGKYREAEEALPAAGSSGDPRVEILRYRVAVETQGSEPAAEVLEAASAAMPSPYAPLEVFAGIAQWDLGRATVALTHFNAALAAQPKNDLALSYRALCLFAQEDFSSAASIWKSHGFSDNAMFRVRVAEYVENLWLRDQSFLGDVTKTSLPASSPAGGPETPPVAAPRPRLRRALNQFYRRNFSRVLRYVSPAPTSNDLEAFLAANSLEMLRRYDSALEYVTPYLPQRAEWPDAFIALNARLRLRQGHIAEAARDFASIVVMGPEDFGLNYYMGIVCLAYDKPKEARQYFLRAFTNYMVDTREFQWWQLEQVLLHPPIDAPDTQSPLPLPS